MLKNIPKIVSPELLKILCEMGHGDEIVIADGNFPSETCGQRVVRADGHGGEAFRKTISQDLSAQEILDAIQATPKQDTLSDQWQSQILARILSRFHVVLISQADPELVRSLKMHPAADLNEALQIAESLVGKDASITVIPEGVSTIIG